MTTRRAWLITSASISISAMLLSACSQSGSEGETSSSDAAPAAADTVYRIGVIAKSNSNPPFQAAKKGAIDAAARLSDEMDGVQVEILWQTPPQEDAQVQAQYVEQLVASGVDGIAISCTDANLLTGALKAAVDNGVVIVTFDSDAPESGRMAYYGVDDKEAGKEVMRHLAEQMGEQGKVAILTGNPAAVNLQARVDGVKEQAGEYEGIGEPTVYSFMPETATEAAAKMQQVQSANPDITGWALVGGWPLYTDNALDGIYENAKVVSMDPLPLPLEYVKKGQVQVLVGQPYYGWGEKSVEMIINKLEYNRTPESELIFADFDIVTEENVEEYGENWKKWLGEG
ncbi:MAG: LacI family transcriptional regulator [Phycisphaerae bacterium]|nr:LacI family transcriptional regulator [Phycisphaerae bacterium]MBM92755.1 LacI family transcriptional regulator [Phycisphaerae bacterium]HCT43950.1 sugar ABC transporter substrate-binding protein [Phycisphaerales bacterium]